MPGQARAREVATPGRRGGSSREPPTAPARRRGPSPTTPGLADAVLGVRPTASERSFSSPLQRREPEWTADRPKVWGAHHPIGQGRSSHSPDVPVAEFRDDEVSVTAPMKTARRGNTNIECSLPIGQISCGPSRNATPNIQHEVEMTTQLENEEPPTGRPMIAPPSPHDGRFGRSGSR